MTVSQKEINYVSPSLVVMCVCYKTVNQQKQLQHCLRQLYANGWLLSSMVQFNISSIRVKRRQLCHTARRYRGCCSNPLPCLITIRSHLVPLGWWVTYCSTSIAANLCALMAVSYFPIVAVDLLFSLFNGRRRSRLPVPTETHGAVITLSQIGYRGKAERLYTHRTHSKHILKHILYI